MATHKEANSNKKTILLPQICKRKYYLFTLFNISTSLLLFVAAVILSSFALPPPQAKGQVIGNIPCAESGGFFYSYQHVAFTPILYSNMPYEIMQAYIIADSLTKNIGNIHDVERALEQIGAASDTINYALKYIYKLVDYNPALYYQVTEAVQAQGKVTTGMVERAIRGTLCPDDQRLPYITADYILHLKINNTEFVNRITGDRCKTMTIAYCNVLDTIKGQVLPNLSTSVLSNLHKINIGGAETYKTNEVSNYPNMSTNFIFDYCNEWLRCQGCIDRPLYNINDSSANSWIKPSKEYIVFLKKIFQCSDSTKAYYSMSPIGGGMSFNMYPVENGQIIDEDNHLGFGNIVPLQAFKHRMQEQINQIKNYGE